MVLLCSPSSLPLSQFALAGDLQGGAGKPVPSLVSVKRCIQLDSVVVSTVAGFSQVHGGLESFLIRHGNTKLEKQRAPEGWGLKQLL